MGKGCLGPRRAERATEGNVEEGFRRGRQRDWLKKRPDASQGRFSGLSIAEAWLDSELRQGGS